MKQRSAVLFVIFLSVICISAAAQTPVESAVDSFLAQAAAIRDYGRSANVPLRTMRREETALALPILALRRQSVANTAAKSSDAELVRAACTRWIGQGRVLMRMGAEVSEILKKRSGQASKDDKELLTALDRAIWVSIAHAEIKKFIGRGSYRGMFEHLKGNAEPLTDAFLFIFRDRLQTAMLRAYAAEGVAELCPQRNRAEVRAAVQQIHQDKDETTAMKTTCMVVLARLGDRKLLDAYLFKHRMQVTEELAKDHAKRSYPRILASYEVMSDLLQRVGDFAKAAEINTDYVRMVLTLCAYDTQPAAARSSIAGQCYDFACILSRLERTDFAFYMLEMSFNWGLRNFDWAGEDKDLSHLRKDARFAALIDKWKSKKAEPGSIRYDDAVYLKTAGRVRPAGQPKSKAPESRPATDNDGR